MEQHTVSAVPAFEPEHPGAILREEFLVPRHLEVKTAAQRLGVSRQALHRVLAGTAAISPEMALRLGRLTGTAPTFWTNLQTQFDLWHGERTLRRELGRIRSMRD